MLFTSAPARHDKIRNNHVGRKHVQRKGDRDRHRKTNKNSYSNTAMRRKEENVLFNDALNTFYLWLCYMVLDLW